MNQAPKTDCANIQRFKKGDREAESWQAAADWFAATYFKPLRAFVRSWLAAANVPQRLQENGEEYLQDFLIREYEKFTVCTRWDTTKPFRPYLYGAFRNFLKDRLSADSPPGTPEEYERYRPDLEAYVRQQLSEAAQRQSGEPVEMPERLLLVEDYVTEFLVYYSSRHPRPPRPQKPASQEAETDSPPQPAEQLPEHETILARLQDECWKYVQNSKRRHKRRGSESLDDREDGYQVAGREILPSLAFSRVWAIELLFEALAAWRGTCDEPEGRKRWKLVKKRVLEPFCGSNLGIPKFKDIYAECNYNSRTEAFNAFDTAKRQIQRMLETVLRKRVARELAETSRDTGATPKEIIELRAKAELQAFQDVLDEENFWHHTSWRDAAASGNAADHRILRRYAEQQLHEAKVLDKPSDPSDTSLPGDRSESVDYSLYDLAIIAQVFSADPEPHEELARQWREFTELSWQMLLGAAGDAAADVGGTEAAELAAASRLGDLLRRPGTPVSLVRQIRQLLKKSRAAGDGEISHRVLKAAEQLCIAAALAGSGERITSKAPKRVKKHLAWLASRPWVDDATRQIARQAELRIT